MARKSILNLPIRLNPVARDSTIRREGIQSTIKCPSYFMILLLENWDGEVPGQLLNK